MGIQALTGTTWRPTVFIHIMKTGGTTFHSFLSNFFLQSKILLVDELIQEGVLLSKPDLISGHVNFEVMRELVPYGRYLTVLRNPVDRCISLLSYTRSAVGRSRWDDRAQAFAKALDTNAIWDVWDDFRDVAAPQYENGMARMLASPYVSDCSEEFALTAETNLRGFDHVFISERMHSAFFCFCVELGRFTDSIGEMPRLNPTAPGRNLEAMPELRRFFLEKNAVDQRLYEVARSMHEGAEIRAMQLALQGLCVSSVPACVVEFNENAICCGLGPPQTSLSGAAFRSSLKNPSAVLLPRCPQPGEVLSLRYFNPSREAPQLRISGVTLEVLDTQLSSAVTTRYLVPPGRFDQRWLYIYTSANTASEVALLSITLCGTQL